MLNYTLAAFRIIISDLEKIFKCVALVTQLSYLVYLITAICFGLGNLAVNIVLCALSALALLFYLIFESFEVAQGNRFYKRSKLCIRYTKLAVNAVSIGTSVYGLCLLGDNAPHLYVIMTAISLVLWVIKIILEAAIIFVKSRYKLLLAGIKIDLENTVGPLRDTGKRIIKPVKTVLGVIDRVRGYEPEPEPEQTHFDDDVTDRQRRVLDEQVAETKQQKAEKKRAKRVAKFTARQARKIHKDTENPSPDDSEISTIT